MKNPPDSNASVAPDPNCEVCAYIRKNDWVGPGRSHCSTCCRTWTSAAECHCMGCHRQFSSERSFDRHQSDGPDETVICHDPATLRRRDGSSRYRVRDTRHGPVWVIADTHPPERLRAAGSHVSDDNTAPDGPQQPTIPGEQKPAPGEEADQAA